MPRQPKYCHHKARDLAYVKLDGKMIYLGKHGSPESRDAYDREILKWRERHGLIAKHSTTVGQLCVTFIEYADTFYVNKAGQPTGEADNFRKALRPLFRLYRHLPAAEFGPRRMLEVQKELALIHVRSQANKHLSRVKSVFRWGVTQEMVPADVIVGLECVRGL
ncbi:MAG: hypothetical protein KF861_16155, partial [Planctomycetaceae bacterium]|nr:hypothetical protein [Planctomycetaceae bacterium]